MISDYCKFLDIPYEKDGRSFHGADCYGLAYLFHKYNGVEIPEFLGRDIYTSKDVAQAINNEKKYFIEVEKKDLIEGDLILFNILGHPVHIGIYIKEDLMLHSFQGYGYSSVQSYMARGWSNRINSFWRFKK